MQNGGGAADPAAPAGVIASAESPSTRRRYIHTRTIGADGPDRFRSTLRGIACAADGGLYAAGDRKVVRYGPRGEVRRTWEIGGPGLCVAVHADERVFIGRPGAIEILEPSGRTADVWTEAERLVMPTAIGFFEDEVLVGDFAGRCIRRFDGAGRFLNDIGTRPPAVGFRVCNGCLDFEVDADGVIHVADPGRHRVSRFSRAGELLGSFGRFDGIDPAGFPGCCNPTNLALTPEGCVVVTEKAGPRVKIYKGDGTLVEIIATELFDPGCKNMDVAVDSCGRIFVVDTVERVIQVFEPSPEEQVP
ncbi:MAG: NHL repeat-containing protein [Phycisphaerales bacterium]|nr:NHL repeat-containing protein [Phycisphaerales bacterium]